MDKDKILVEIDNWIARLRPRYMDLVGDYAGDEFFVVDGDSLCQMVLDDDLLAIGKETNPGFQIVHALYSFEQAILALKHRECNFEIAFFDDNKYGTIWAGKSRFRASSRLLAREILKAHARQLSNIACVEFIGLEDGKWKEYVQAKQPMFVFCHSGPGIDLLDEKDTMMRTRTLLQRTFMKDILASRLAVSLINEAKYVDAKVLSFVYERQRLGTIQSHQPELWDVASAAAMEACSHSYNELVPDWNQRPFLKDRVSWLLKSTAMFVANSGDNIDCAIAFVFLASQIVLSRLSIEQRAQAPCAVDPHLRQYLVSKFYPKLFGYLALSLHNSSFFPDIDGNIFLVTLNTIIGASEMSLDQLLGSELSQEAQTKWISAGIQLPELAVLSRFEAVAPVSLTSAEDMPYELLNFSHPVLDPYLKTVAVGTATRSIQNPDTQTRLDELCDKTFVDEKHWHSSKSILPKHLGGQDDSVIVNLTSWERMKKLRREQRFMTNMQRHAQTLTGAKGAPIQRIVISELGKRSLHSSNPLQDGRILSSNLVQSGVKHNKPPKPKTPQLSSAQKLKAKIAAEKQTKKASEDEIWWLAQLKELELVQKLDERATRVENILRGKRAETGWLSVEIPLYRLHIMLLAWIEIADTGGNATHEKHAVNVLNSIHVLRGHQELFPTAAQTLASILLALGFDRLAPPIAQVQDDREFSFKFVKLLRSKSGKKLHPNLSINISTTEFQLKAYGIYMDRSMGNVSDSRVTFEPDEWQRQVLDNIDNDISTLVVAPTSAGKTFSSFYAMEKVLREGNDGIIVYVSPTKALCQQIAADVYARFSKNMKGKTVWAIHTRDFRVHDPLKTQILVTVPEILSTMLLSPPMANVWTPHIKWIILDEIHSIGQLDGGQVWEHILLLSTCPILGLSATIGQPEAFSNWLGSVQAAHDQKYSMVEHKHRYSHLRKHIWQMPKSSFTNPKTFTGLHLPGPKDEYMPIIHPMSALLFGGRTIPPDLALESQDCLSLYEMLKNCVSDGQLAHLAPDAYFKDLAGDFLKQADVIKYEEELKGVAAAWMREPGAEQGDSCYHRLLSELDKQRQQSGSGAFLQDAHLPVTARLNFIDLLHKLHAQGNLPCLAFNFDRSGCEMYAKTLVNVLTENERQWRETNPRWIEKMKQWELWKTKAKARGRESQRASRQKKSEDTQEAIPSGWGSSFDPDEPAAEFSFASTVSGYSREELQKDINDLEYFKTPEYLISALKRGIAVHHAGMPKGYRSLVESLFRLGFCRVVISTGTLALGINAPAKTVIFLEDSPFLTALMYRQCAGRAGRRGFDLLGNVVFYNFPIDRVHRLMLSRIPPLTGNWPLTTTLCLRLLNLLTGSNEAPAAVSAIDSFLRLPRLSVSSEQSRDEVLHHMRFSIDFLQRSRLLSASGQTSALFGVVGHLYYDEPGNLAFAALVRNGVLHQMCSTFRKNRISTEKNIICLVATLFARRPLPYFMANEQVLAERRARFPSVIQLPSVPNYVLDVLANYNKEILQVFRANATTFATQHLEKTPDNMLPLSKTEIVSQELSFGGPLHEALEMSRIKNRVARSTFVGNSGHNDTFKSVEDLCRSTRSGLHLNGNSIPYFDYSRPVNAYAYDFWQHESVRPLSEANGVREGEVWFALQSFYLALVTLTASLQVLLIKPAALEEVDTAAADDDEELYANVGKAEAQDEEDDSVEHTGVVDRPEGIPEEDWLVYEAFQSVTHTFYQKWHKMWA